MIIQTIPNIQNQVYKCNQIYGPVIECKHPAQHYIHIYIYTHIVQTTPSKELDPALQSQHVHTLSKGFFC